MRSEEEIRKAIRHFIVTDEGFLAAFIEDCCIEQMQTLEAAIEELLALRRRLADREALAKSIRPAMYSNMSSEVADAIIKYLEGTDGA